MNRKQVKVGTPVAVCLLVEDVDTRELLQNCLSIYRDDLYDYVRNPEKADVIITDRIEHLNGWVETRWCGHYCSNPREWVNCPKGVTVMTIDDVLVGINKIFDLALGNI